MEIRRLAPNDAPAYRVLRLRALREHPEAFTSSFEESEKQPPQADFDRLANPSQKFWGAFEDGCLCGMVGLDIETRAKARHKATLVGMYVESEVAGKGIGRALVDVAIADARASGLELLVLTVTEGNSSAAQLYERCGFKSFGIEPRAIKVAGRAYSKNHMVLHLSLS